ncbi:hypothetical protein EON62_02565 [archaeon]|nr:MAG: hypothetical protein EON62_02565 [archaeon]
MHVRTGALLSTGGRACGTWVVPTRAHATFCPPLTRAPVPSLQRAAAPVSGGAVRFLNLHEYQSKDLLESYGVQVQKGRMAKDAEEAAKVASWILGENPAAELILKAQIHAGGRGKGVFTNGFKGGVKICSTYVCNLPVQLC